MALVSNDVDRFGSDYSLARLGIAELNLFGS
ncbi:MAG: hypothetical protein ACI9G1_001816 [Pirellulaceae bacterium]|jgi:hypothetical protein